MNIRIGLPLLIIVLISAGSSFAFFFSKKDSSVENLRMNTVSPITACNPFKKGNSADDNCLDLTAASLINYGSDVFKRASLAEDYSISKDGLLYTFKLKDNIYFHNNRKITAFDFKKTLNQFAIYSKSQSHRLEKVLKKIKGYKLTVERKEPNLAIDVKNERVFTIELSKTENTISFIDLINEYALSPYPMEAFDQNKDWVKLPVGTGLYKVDVLNEDVVQFSKFDKSFNKEKYEDLPPKVTFYQYKEGANYAEMLENQELDICNSPEKIDALQDKYSTYHFDLLHVKKAFLALANFHQITNRVDKLKSHIACNIDRAAIIGENPADNKPGSLTEVEFFVDNQEGAGVKNKIKAYCDRLPTSIEDVRLDDNTNIELLYPANNKILKKMLPGIAAEFEQYNITFQPNPVKIPEIFEIAKEYNEQNKAFVLLIRYAPVSERVNDQYMFFEKGNAHNFANIYDASLCSLFDKAATRDMEEDDRIDISKRINFKIFKNADYITIAKGLTFIYLREPSLSRYMYYFHSKAHKISDAKNK